MIPKGFGIVFLACFFSSLSSGQDSSIVSVTCSLGVGRGCVVDKVLQPDGSYLGKVLTAAHMVEAVEVIHNGTGMYIRPELTIKFSNGETTKGLSVTDEHKFGEGDTACVTCKIPAAINAVERGGVKDGDVVVWHLQDGNYREPIKAVDVKGRSVYSDLRLRPGDSGGPVSKDGKIVGVVSGGRFWMESETIDPSTNKKVLKLFTWPARAGLAK